MATSAGTRHRIFISEVFRFEELAFELITPGFYRVFFRDMEIGEFNCGRASLQSCAKSGLSLSMSALPCGC